MRACIVAVGDRMPPWVAAGVAEYTKRLSRELPVKLIEVKPRPRGKGCDHAHAALQEGVALLEATPVDHHMIALDGGGKSWSSERLARHLAEWRMGGRDLAFLIGGADGHSAQVRARAEDCWSLGPLTLPHMLVRLLVLEQLYRACSILAGHPYHRG